MDQPPDQPGILKFQHLGEQRLFPCVQSRVYLRSIGLQHKIQFPGPAPTAPEDAFIRRAGQVRPPSLRDCSGSIPAASTVQGNARPVVPMRLRPYFLLTMVFLISAMALAGFRPFGQVLVQFMIV